MSIVILVGGRLVVVVVTLQGTDASVKTWMCADPIVKTVLVIWMITITAVFTNKAKTKITHRIYYNYKSLFSLFIRVRIFDSFFGETVVVRRLQCNRPQTVCPKVEGGFLQTD